MQLMIRMRASPRAYMLEVYEPESGDHVLIQRVPHRGTAINIFSAIIKNIDAGKAFNLVSATYGQVERAVTFELKTGVTLYEIRDIE